MTIASDGADAEASERTKTEANLVLPFKWARFRSSPRCWKRGRFWAMPEAPQFANLSAASLPRLPSCPFTPLHCKTTLPVNWPWKPKKPRHHRHDESKHLSGGQWAGRVWASKNPRLQGNGFVFDCRFLSICVPNRCSNPSVSQRQFLRKFLAGLQISQPWGPATKLLRTIQVQGFPQTRFSIQQLLSTEVHTCGRVDLVPRRHCRPCATRTKSCRFAYRLFGQRHTAKKLFYSTQKLFATNNVAGDNQESMMLMHVTCKSQPYRRGNLAFKAACSLSVAIFVSPCKRPVIHLTSLALPLATLDSRFAYEKTKGETTKKKYVFCNICK